MARYSDIANTGVVALKVPVSTAVVAGDVLYRGMDGLTRPLPNNETSFPILTGTRQYTVSDISADDTGSNSAVCILTSGDIVYAFKNSSQIKFARYNAAGDLQGSVTTVESGLSNIYSLTMCALSGGGFFIGYNNSTTEIRGAIYNNSGSATKSAFQLSATNISSAGCIDSTALLNGNFIVAFNNSTTSVLFRQFNASGTLVGSETTVEAVDSTDTADQGIRCATLSTGDFVIAYRNTTTNMRFGRYNTSNVLQGSLTVAAASAGLPFLCRTSYGFVCGRINSVAVRFNKYSNTGTLLPAFGTAATNDYVAMVGTPKRAVYNPTTGGMIVANADSTSNFTVLDDHGSIIDAPFPIGAGNSDAAIATDGSSVYCISSGGSTYPYITKYSIAMTNQTTYSRLPVSRSSTLKTAPLLAASSTVSGRLQSCKLGNGLAVHAVYGTGVYLYIADAEGNIKQSRMLDYSTSHSGGICVLSNGNIAIANIYNNFQSVVILDQNLNYVTSVSVGATASAGAGRIVALTGGGFAVAWSNGATNVQYAVYSNSGSVVKAATSLGAYNANNNYSSIGMCSMPDGGFMVVLQNTTTDCRYLRFNAAGTSIVDSALVSATAASKQAVVGLPDGGFAVLENDNGSMQFSRFNAANTAIITAASVKTINSPTDICCALSPDNTIIVTTGAAATSIDVIELGQSGIALNEWSLPITTTNNRSLVVFPDGSIQVGSVTASALQLARFQRYSPIVGVATESGSSLVSAVVRGPATTRYTWPMQSFNCIGAGGVKGVISGTGAVLDNAVQSLG